MSRIFSPTSWLRTFSLYVVAVGTAFVAGLAIATIFPSVTDADSIPLLAAVVSLGAGAAAWAGLSSVFRRGDRRFAMGVVPIYVVAQPATQSIFRPIYGPALAASITVAVGVRPVNPGTAGSYSVFTACELSI